MRYAHRDRRVERTGGQEPSLRSAGLMDRVDVSMFDRWSEWGDPDAGRWGSPAWYGILLPPGRAESWRRGLEA